jgi:hypothetical protein
MEHIMMNILYIVHPKEKKKQFTNSLNHIFFLQILTIILKSIFCLIKLNISHNYSIKSADKNNVKIKDFS